MVSVVPTATAWSTTTGARHLPSARLGDLVSALHAEGRRVVGPVVEDGAIRTREIEQAAELPFGWVATATPGKVRLERRPPTDPGAGRAFDNGPAWAGMKPW